MKYLISFLLLFLLSPLFAEEEQLQQHVKNDTITYVETRITTFFHNWFMATSECEYTKTANEYLTKALCQKIERLSNAYDMDPFFKSQDISQYADNTLHCRHLKECWYEVSFQFDNQSALTIIPVCVNGNTLDARISRIAVEGKNMLPDSLFTIVPKPIIYTNALAFVKSFYEEYTRMYATMPDNLKKELSQLQKAYCTSAVIRKARQKLKQRGKMEGKWTYDLIVGNYDFDATWRPSLYVQELTPSCFWISYKWENYAILLKVSVIRDGRRYKISQVKRLR